MLRLARPSIEPIHFSLPSTLHLSLLSFPHFTFLLHIRLSPLNTPYAEDVIPETCFALVQLAPGLLLLLPRAAIAIVLLTAFSSSGSGPADETIGRDPSFFSLNDQLTPYAKGVLLAFITWVAVRFLLVLLSAIELWVSSCHPLGGLIGSGIRLSRRQSSETPFTPRPPPVSRDPAQTRSPQISWLSEENAFHWDWKDRSRARIQDAFELCTIRRPGVLGDSAFWKESRHVSEQNDTVGPPSLASPRTLTTQSEVSSDDFLKQVVAEMPSRPATRHGDDPPRPESLLEPMSSRNMDPPVHDAPYHHVGASTSSHDLFYTPTGGNTPSDEKARSFVESQGISAHLGIRGFSDPSEFGVLVINPNRDSSTFSEVLTIDDSAEPVCLKHHRVHHQTGSESA